MRFGLEQDVPEQLWKIIEYQPFYRTYEDYITRVQCLTEVASEDKREHGARQTKRPRRQAAQAVMTHTLPLSMFQSSRSSTIDHMTPSDDLPAYDSPHESSIDGGVEATYDRGADDLHRMNQLGLWIQNLSTILHEEARKLRVRRKAVGRDERGKPSQRIPKTPTHIELLKKLPPLRRLEANLRGSIIGAVETDLVESESYIDNVKDTDWEHRRKRKKCRKEFHTPGPT